METVTRINHCIDLINVKQVIEFNFLHLKKNPTILMDKNTQHQVCSEERETTSVIHVLSF